MVSPPLRRAEIVVVGAGIHGASVAFNLVRSGERNVVLVDKGSPGSGATGRSASFVRHHYSNEICVRIVQESLRVLRRWGEEVGGEVEFVPRPLLLLSGPEHVGALRENVAMHRSLGVSVRLLEVEDAAEAYPYLDLRGIVLAAQEEDSGYGDAYQVNSEYVRRFQELGGELLTNIRVTGLEHEKGKVRGVATEKGRIDSRSVVLAPGPWFGDLGTATGVQVPVRPALLSLGVLMPPKPLGQEPMVFDMTTGTYWRSDGSGNLLVGTDEETDGTWDPDNLPEGVSFEFVTHVAGRLGNRWPAMAEARFVRGWVGVDGATPDLHPIIGSVPRMEGLYLSAGYSGHGFKFSPAVGKCLAELILDGRYKTLDLSPFSPERFSSGRTFRSRYPMAVVQ